MIYGDARVSTEAQDLTGSTAQLKAAGRQEIFREKITGMTAERPQLQKLMAALGHGDVVIIPAVDRLSRDTTGLRAGVGNRSLAEPFLERTSDFAEIVPSLALPRSWNNAVLRSARHEAARTQRRRASNSDVSRNSPTTSSVKRSSGAMWMAKRCAR